MKRQNIRQSKQRTSVLSTWLLTYGLWEKRTKYTETNWKWETPEGSKKKYISGMGGQTVGASIAGKWFQPKSPLYPLVCALGWTACQWEVDFWNMRLSSHGPASVQGYLPTVIIRDNKGGSHPQEGCDKRPPEEFKLKNIGSHSHSYQPGSAWIALELKEQNWLPYPNPTACWCLYLGWIWV